MEKAVLIGIDVGSTNIKCVAIEPGGQLLGYESLASADALRKDEHRRLDAEKLFARACEAVRALLAKLPAGTAVLGVAAASVGCTAFYLDAMDRQLHLPRSGTREPPLLDDGVARTGYPPGYPNAGLELMRADEGALRRVRRVLSVGDYIAYRLSGEHLRDLSTAGSMSMYDRTSGDWWDFFTRETGLSARELGQVRESGTLAGSVTRFAAELSGLPLGTPVVLGGHDYPASAFALGADAGDVFNVMGTFEMVASFFDRQPQWPRGWTMFSDCHCVPGRYSLACEALSGAPLEWLRDLVGGGSEPGFWARMDAEMMNLPPSFEGGRRALFIPRLYGDFFPVRASGARGGFIGLSGQTGAADMARAVIEGQLMYSRRMFAAVSRAMGAPPRRVIVAGGGSNGRFLMQAKADIWGVPVDVPQVTEAAATGAALLAGVGAGVYRDHAQAGSVYQDAPRTEYVPNAARAQVYSQAYERVFLPALEAFSALDQNANGEGER